MIKNLLKIVLASLLITSATGTAKAVTVDDLVQYGGDAIEIFYGNYKELSLHSYVNGYVHFEKVNDNTVVLKNYYGLCDVPFTLKDNKLIMAYTEDDDNPTNILEVESSKYAFIYLTPQTAVNQTYDSQNGLRYTSATITEKDGEYEIDFNQPIKIEAYKGSNGNYTLAGREWKNMYSIVVFKPNATVTDYDVRASKARTYKGKVTFNADDTFSFINFGAKGYGIYNWMNGNMIYSTLKKLTGGFDRSKGEVWMDFQQITSDVSDLNNNGYGNVLSYKLCRVDTAVSPYDFYQPLNGPVDFSDPHHTGESAWVTNGGDRRTLETVNMKFRPWTAYNVSADSYAGQPVVSNTVVTVPDHDVTLQLQMTGASASNEKVAASWNATKNEFYVSSYDLMLVPGKYTTGAAVPLDKAVVVANVEKNTTGTYTVEGDYAAKVGDDYTLFIRANYTESTGLTPTYHCLSNVVAEAAGVTLADIIATGTDGETYTVSNDLQAVYVSGNTVYAKDAQGFANRQECGDLRDTYDNKFFDQSNWVRITLADASAIVNGTVIKGGTLKGVFTRDANGNPSLDASAQSAPTTAEGAAYVGNLYNLANFAASQPSEGHGIFLVTPKPYEYARVQWAIINADQTTFSVPGSIHYLCGTASIDWSLAEPGLKERFNHTGEGYAYHFNAIVYRNKAMSETAGNEAIADGGWTIAPLNANGFDDISTGTPTVTTVKTVASVRYFTMVGVECADRTDAPCVKVVTYTNGTVEAIKLPRR